MARRTNFGPIATAVLLLVLVFAIPGPAAAADLKFLYPGALHTAMHDLTHEFESTTGHKITSEDGPAGAIAARVEKGEAADVAIATTSQIEALAKQGRIVPGSQVVLAKVGMGLATAKGRAKPDISSVEALKRALDAAKTIGFPDPAGGSSAGAWAAKLLASFDNSAELTAKVRLFPTGAPLFAAVAKGDVEICFGQLTELIAAPGLDLIGNLPAPAQNYTEFAGGIVASGKQAEAGKALLGYLTSPAAAATMKAKGLEPRN